MDEFIEIKGVKITHPGKIMFPASKISKLDLVNYYLKVEQKILPELRDRPISLVRSPAGLSQGKFFQKHPSESFPAYIERIKLEEKEGTGIYILIDEIADILYLVNIGVLEFHTSNSLVSDYEHPDKLIFDLDPDEKLDMSLIHKCATDLKELLEYKKFKPTIKTSGGKGYHITAWLKDINKKMNWDEAHSYAKELAKELGTRNEVYISEVSKDDRKGKIFVDYLRNSRGGTTVAAWSTRAKEGAPISMPIEWEDLINTTPKQYNIINFQDFE